MSTNLDSPTDKKKWCVMVYFAADVDLGSAAMADLEQMKAAGSSGEVDLLAQVNSGGSQSIRRYHLHKDTYLQEDLITNRNANDEEQLLYNVDAKQDLIEFVRWCATRSEAEHYALILWGHGQGWKADNPDPCFVPGAGNPRKSIHQQLEILAAEKREFAASLPASMPTTLLNGETGFLDNKALREVLAEAKKTFGQNIDILGMDACLMAMAEICCQVSDSVNYLVACEDTVPDESWPYDSILKLLVANADQMTPEIFSSVIVWKFIFDFGQKRKYVTQSICKLETISHFTAAVKRLVDALLNQMSDPEVRWSVMIARSHVQSFYIREYVDLYDFCRLLRLNCKNPWITAACKDVMDAIWQQSSAASNGSNRKLVFDYGTYGYPLKRSFGVSVYFPCVDEIPKCYTALKFCEETRWHEFLGAFLKSPQGVVAVGERVAARKDKDVLDAEIVVSPHGERAFVFADKAVVATDLEVTGGTTSNTGGSGSGNNGDVKSTYGDPIKTTYGDVIKTTLGDPIKKPELPSWILPTAPFSDRPIRSGTILRNKQAPVRTKTEPICTCTCGHKPQE